MRSPLPLLVAAALALASSPAVGQDEGFVCDIPTAGCTNGMFNQALCVCECISPFCPDMNGDCTNPSDNCGGNKWKDCTRGVNCPWWVNPLKAESCFTGADVPLGLWKVYNTRAACCSTNFPYSEYCDAKPQSTGPTRHPTIAAPEDDIYEVIPIKFDVSGLPDDFKMRDLKDQMTTVLKRILFRLSERIPGLKVSSVEEKVVLTRALAGRGLQEGRDVSLYFNVYVIRDDGKKFGPLIITEIRDSYDEVLDQIQTFADTNYFGSDLNLNWCTSQNGKFELCVKEIQPPSEPPSRPPPRRPTIPARSPTSIIIQNGDPPVENKGLPGWAITLIIIIVLLFLCCIAYAIFAMCFKQNNDSNEVRNNIYMEEKNRNRSRGSEDVYFLDEKSHASRRSRRTRGSRRPRIAEFAYEEEEEDNKDEVQIVLSQPQNPRFHDDSFSINTYGTRTPKRPARDPTMYIPGQENRPDPTSYIPGQENRPDPGTFLIENGKRNYYQEDPPLKPKRDPTMYVEGRADPSVYAEGRRDASMYDEGDYDNEGDPPLKPKRDPTMYVDGQASEFGDVEGASRAEEYSAVRGGEEEGYNGDPYGVGRNKMSRQYDEEEEEYDDYGFRESELEGEYMTSETNAEYAQGRKDPSYYAETTSYRAKSPKSSSKRSKKSKKKSRSAR